MVAFFILQIVNIVGNNSLRFGGNHNPLGLIKTYGSQDQTNNLFFAGTVSWHSTQATHRSPVLQ